MATRGRQWLLDLSEWLYRRLLFLYPHSFRRDYGSALVQLFRDDSRAVYREQGWTGLPALWLHTLNDLLITICQEHLACLLETSKQIFHLERNQWMTWENAGKTNLFGQRLAEILSEEPIYYRLLTAPEPTARMSDVIESMALEGDLEEPDTMLSLFQSLAGDSPQTRKPQWLVDLSEAARQIYQTGPLTDMARITDRLVRMIYLQPQLYELIAAFEPGYGLQDIVESLALEGGVDDVETMLQLMGQLQQGSASAAVKSDPA
jgi:hypothetical protein